MYHLICILFLIIAFQVKADKELIYDENKGIIFVDKDKPAQKNSPAIEKKAQEQPMVHIKKAPVKKSPKQQATREEVASELIADREKDPPEVYFQSALTYYKNNDFENALKNFTYAADHNLKPEYLLWMGKTFRQLNKPEQLVFTMERILKEFPDSDIADDALFELAFHYQTSDNYEKAIAKYTQLTEQYPFGVSYTNGQPFLELARKQIHLMRGEMMGALGSLGIETKTVPEAYAQFQTAQHLAVSGEGNPETVKAIKKLYLQKLAEAEKKKVLENKIQKSTIVVFIAGVLILANLISLLVVWLKNNELKQRIHLLRDSLAHLN
jgi:tetratricopeptide (TPR) repeat protein